jgi:hypothetical protein
LAAFGNPASLTAHRCDHAASGGSDIKIASTLPPVQVGSPDGVTT